MDWTSALKCLGVVAAGMAMLRCALARRGPPRAWGWRRLHADEQGSAGALDFAMTLCVYIVIVFCSIQWMLILNASFFVHYAAYCAARSAVVVIPEERSGEPRNVYQPGGDKHKLIRECAAFAVSPVSPSSSIVAPDGAIRHLSGIMSVSRPVLSGYAAGPYARTDLWPAKASNALGQTRLNLQPPGNPARPHGAIAVEVIYEYYLSLPFANEILRSGNTSLRNACRLRATGVMMNEGNPILPSQAERQ